MTLLSSAPSELFKALHGSRIIQPGDADEEISQLSLDFVTLVRPGGRVELWGIDHTQPGSSLKHQSLP